MPELPSPWRDVLDSLSEHLRRTDRRAVLITGLAIPALAVAVLLAARPPTPRAELTLPRVQAATDEGEPSEGSPTADAEHKAALVAHAAGAVARPGLYQLVAGARVADLLAAAGGAAPGADLDRLNLAARVTDGERVYVPRVGEATAEPVSGSAATAASSKVNLNTATLEQLDTLPGVGPATAQAIVDYRTRHGRFRSVSQLLEVRGIGESRLAQLRPRVTV